MMDTLVVTARFDDEAFALFDGLRRRHFPSHLNRTPQDAQGFRPHVTIQNKADPVVAKALFERMRDEFQPYAFGITGVDLWFYRGGEWERAGFAGFGGRN
jgi:hypothetical protein